MLPSFVLSFLGLGLLLGLFALLGFGVWGVWGLSVFLWGSLLSAFSWRPAEVGVPVARLGSLLRSFRPGYGSR